MRTSLILFSIITLFATQPIRAETVSLPIRALHCFAPSRDDAARVEKFIREDLKKEGLNVLVLEFGYSFQHKSHPELGEKWHWDAESLKPIVKACKESGIKLIPEFDCLGHQSWAENTSALLKKHPEFDETPHLKNKELYCREWCTLHPDVHKIVFDLLDELAAACESDTVHCGMDEVFLIGDAKCPRCGGKDKARLFADEVKRLHDHLAEKNLKMWIWGDRLIDGKATKIGEWEAAFNHTHGAIDLIPKDIVICDWHYEKAHDTPKMFSNKGFKVLACPWKKTDVALGQLKVMNELPKEQALGLFQTTWTDLGKFAKAYHGEVKSGDAAESAKCFKALFEELRKIPAQ